jgi:hypothetical protein
VVAAELLLLAGLRLVAGDQFHAATSMAGRALRSARAS